MRAIMLILIIVVVALIAAFSTGLIDITQTRGAKAPGMTADNGVVSATAGQSPAFEVQTGSVEVGSRGANVSLPKVEVTRDPQSVQVPVVEVRRPADAQQNAAR